MPIAIGTLAMLVGNVGLQVFNNWSNSRQNDKLQQKREEFERAARDHQTERMWQILCEGQAITLELEKKRQEERLKELESEMAQLLKNLAYQQTISNWPLSVLPIVMKNQALGNLLAHQNESYAMHCILTPSNCPSFNKHVFPYVEQSLESYCNQYWSADSSHPVLFYSGAWASNDAPTQPQISSMQAALSNLPTMLITPFFRPCEDKLIFQVRMWGVGATGDNHDFQDIWEIEPTDFRHAYSTSSDYDKKEHLLDEAINDIVPYLQCLIGYMADTYFWSSHGITPIFPTLLITNNASKKYLNEGRDYYSKLIENPEGSNIPFLFSLQQKIKIIIGNSVLQDKNYITQQFDDIILSYCNYCIHQDNKTYDTIESVSHNVTSGEIPFYPLIKTIYENIVPFSKDISYYLSDIAYKIIMSSLIVNKESYELFEIDQCEIEYILSFAYGKKNDAIEADSFVFIIWNTNLIIATYCNNMSPCIYMKDNHARFFIFRCNNGSFDCNWNELYYNYNLQNKKISKMDKKTFEEKFGQRFEKVGRGLGKMFDAATSLRLDGDDSVWGDQNQESQVGDATQRIVTFFIANAGNTIPAQRVENMTLQFVFDWVDKNVPPIADKVYIVKGYNDAPKKHVFCVFFGSGNEILIKGSNPRICFITDQFNDEMKQTFNNNNICEIPLKK